MLPSGLGHPARHPAIAAERDRQAREPLRASRGERPPLTSRAAVPSSLTEPQRMVRVQRASGLGGVVAAVDRPHRRGWPAQRHLCHNHLVNISVPHLLLVIGVLLVVAALLWLLIAAIVSIVNSPASSTEKALWIVLCVVFSFLGPILWFAFGKKAARTG